MENAVLFTHLPSDATREEVARVAAVCGVVAEDHAAVPLININIGNEGTTAVVVFLRPESKDLAFTLLDGSVFRPGLNDFMSVRDVTPDEWEAYEAQLERQEPSTKRAKGSTKANGVRAHLQRMERRLAWDNGEDEGDKKSTSAARSGRVVVLRHMFSPSECEVLRQYVNSADEGLSQSEATAILSDLEEEVGSEAQESLDLDVPPSVRVYSVSTHFVVMAKFDRPEDAERAVRLMHGRLFDGRVVEAALYDGSFPLRRPLRVPSSDDADRLSRFGHELEEVEGSD